MLHWWRRSTRKLLLRTYCWGLVPIIAATVYLADGDWLGRSSCSVRSVTSSKQIASTTTPAFENASSCCTMTPHDIEVAKAHALPFLVSSKLELRSARGNDNGGAGNRVCVYGMNFGEQRGMSTLVIGGVSTTAYERWSDPGAPYEPGHYAEICAQLRGDVPSGSVGLQMITPLGLSNTLPVSLDTVSQATVSARAAGAFSISR